MTPRHETLQERVPELCTGDNLTRDEFERRFAAMPHIKKAELVEGVVFVETRVKFTQHGEPHAHLAMWLGSYVAHGPKLSVAIRSSVRLDLDNEVQPDVLLRLPEAFGGRSKIAADDILEGPPDLIVEIAASSASYDLHDKLHAYRRNGVREYVVWRVDDSAVDWFVLSGGRYEPLPSQAGAEVLRSELLPGLWLDVPALLDRDLGNVIECLRRGLASSECAAFIAAVERAADRP